MRGIIYYPSRCGWLAGLFAAILIGGGEINGRAGTIWVTNTAASGLGSLSQAIITADTNAGSTIAFQISGTPPFSIAPTNALPAITASVLIDGTTQPGYTNKPVIQITGTNTAGQTIGLRFSAGASTLRGLVINGFPIQAIELDSPANTIQGNFIGTDVTGTHAVGDGGAGIVVQSGENLIGGTNAGEGNVISGGNLDGIYLVGGGTNTVQGNLIGVTASGSGALGNQNFGIVIYGGGDNLIGGPVAVARNVVSGNGQSGVYIETSSSNNVVQGNLLGTDISGGVALGNSGDGVTLIQVSGNVISSNVISANAYGGVSISGPAGSGNRVLGNLIGTDITGKIKLGNLNYGVQLAGASNNVVGGAMAGNGNLISGNVLDGVVLTGSGTMGNWVVGNYIGTDRSGTLALGNQGDGVNMGAVSGNVIASNVISANVYSGVDIVGPGASGNVLLGNLIGTDVLGKSKLANLYYGVYLLNANANVVGGPNAGNGNVISGNFQSGIYLVGGGTNEILGNNIGTDSSGTLALGNQGVGMFLRGTTGNNIGGITAGSGNLISANGAQGLFLTNSSWNVIQGNFIGTKADGTNALGNVAHGIDLQVNANSNIIGGAVTGAANHIAWAQTIYAGVRVRPGSQNNLISGNAIFGNGGLGIDLGAYQVNPNVDCENGVLAGSANNGQNYPVLTNVITGAGGTVVRGYLDSAVGETYQLQFFANPTFDPSGYGQGQVYLGSSTLTLGGSCTANFTALLPTSIPVGWMVSATATDPVNDTSEFSEDVPAVSPPGLSIARSGASGDILISYPNLTGPLTLQETFSLLPPVNWVPVTGSLELTNGTYYVSNYAGQTNVFYRLTVP